MPIEKASRVLAVKTVVSQGKFGAPKNSLTVGTLSTARMAAIGKTKKRIWCRDWVNNFKLIFSAFVVFDRQKSKSGLGNGGAKKRYGHNLQNLSKVKGNYGADYG